MSFDEFMDEYNRMCDSVFISTCPLHQRFNTELSTHYQGCKKVCLNICAEHPKEATEIVKIWAKEHPKPEITNGTVLYRVLEETFGETNTKLLIGLLNKVSCAWMNAEYVQPNDKDTEN